MESKTKKMTTIAMLAAMAFVMVTFVRIPIVLFLEYEPKDIIITLGGFIWGPLASFIVSSIELVTISEDGILGFVMDRIYDKCCGIDVHKKLIVACFRHISFMWF